MPRNYSRNNGDTIWGGMLVITSCVSAFSAIRMQGIPQRMRPYFEVWPDFPYQEPRITFFSTALLSSTSRHLSHVNCIAGSRKPLVSDFRIYYLSCTVTATVSNEFRGRREFPQEVCYCHALTVRRGSRAELSCSPPANPRPRGERRLRHCKNFQRLNRDSDATRLRHRRFR
ncbi:hypothetical protein VTN96DRAFT_4645 [Rasamsonia emersonii]